MRLYFFASLTALAIVFQASLAQSQDSKTTFGDPSAEAPIQTRLREVYGKETARDLARWGKALYEGRAFDRWLLAEMLNGAPAKLGPESKYGLGVIIRPTALGISYGHSGFFPGYLTEMLYFPTRQFAVALQVNTSAPRATGRPLLQIINELATIIAAAQPERAKP